MDIKKTYDTYVLHTYNRVGPIFVRGKGSFLWDTRGEKYLDFFPGWGVSILGHAHPQLAKVLAHQARTLVHLPNNLYHPHQALLAKKIIASSFPGKVFFANSGAEAIEGALKLARAYGKGKRFEIISMEKAFHGRTFGALSATPQAKYQKPFEPLLPGFRSARFGDFEDFVSKVNEKTVAVILEPIQGEGGVNIPSAAYFAKLREFCTQHDILLIVDEVQTGMGRTGTLFCFQNFKITPDVVTLAKGLGGGFPISAFIVQSRFADVLGPGLHASTFGGSPLATRVACEIFDIIKREHILANVHEIEKLCACRLLSFKKRFSIVKDVRGMGAMWAIELAKDGFDFTLRALKEKLILNCTQKVVLRIMPALTITQTVLEDGFRTIAKLLERY